MRILLIIPKVTISQFGLCVPNIGILYVSSALKKAGHNVFCLNMHLIPESGQFDEIKKCINENKIDVIGIGGLVRDYKEIKKLLNMCKAVNPNILTWIGGGIITYSAIPVMTGIQSADIGMIGEGEITSCELMNSLEQNKTLDEIAEERIPGLIVRKSSGELVMAPTRDVIEDIDSIPWPDYEGCYYWKQVKEFYGSSRSDIVSVSLTTSRSCPFSCTFCCKSGGGKYRQRSLDSVFEELDWLVGNYGVTHVFLNDELFAVNKDRIEEFCRRIKKYNVKWFPSLRVGKHITRELLENMRDSGCIQVLYGLESGDDSVLKSMNKRITSEEIERVVKLTTEVGFQVEGNFIFGDTAETMQTAVNTVNFVKKNLQYFKTVNFGHIILFPGSALYDKAVKEGKIKNELEFIENDCPIVNVSSMTDDEFFYLMQEYLPSIKREQLEAIEDQAYDFYVDKKDKFYKFSSVCPVCGKENKYSISPYVSIMLKNPYICSECGHVNSISVTKNFAIKLKDSLSNVMKSNQVGLWGVGQNFLTLESAMGGVPDGNYYLLDSSDFKNEKKHSNGMLIRSPKEIRDLNINYVVEFTGYMHDDVLNMVHEICPEVHNVYSAFELPVNT